jgi:hypothetical protein
MLLKIQIYQADQLSADVCRLQAGHFEVSPGFRLGTKSEGFEGLPELPREA